MKIEDVTLDHLFDALEPMLPVVWRQRFGSEHSPMNRWFVSTNIGKYKGEDADLKTALMQALTEAVADGYDGKFDWIMIRG